MLSGPLQSDTQVGVKGVYILTTVYNEEVTLPNLISHIVKWKEEGEYGRKLIKWVIVDDGSNDKSFEIIKNALKKYSFIKFLVLKKNQGKAWAYRKGAEWIIAGDSIIENRIIFQLDSDIAGLKPKDIDIVIDRLCELVALGKYVGPRIASLALVPSGKKHGIRKWIRETMADLTAKERIAITGQRAYFGKIMQQVIFKLTPETGFGLEPLLNAETIVESKRIKAKFGLTDEQRRELIAVTHWSHISHMTFMEKVFDSSSNPVRKFTPLNFIATLLIGVWHYLSIGWDCTFGVIKGFFTKKWMSKRQLKKEKALGNIKKKKLVKK